MAEKSAASADKITDMIKEVQYKTSIAVSSIHQNNNDVEESLAIIENVKNTLIQIKNASLSANEQVMTISKEIENLALNSDEFVKIMENMSAITEEAAAGAEEISSITEDQKENLQKINKTSEHLSNMSSDLIKCTSVFTV